MSSDASTLQMAFLMLPQAQSPAPGRVQNELAEGQLGMAALITPSWDGLPPSLDCESPEGADGSLLVITLTPATCVVRS